MVIYLLLLKLFSSDLERKIFTSIYDKLYTTSKPELMEYKFLFLIWRQIIIIYMLLLPFNFSEIDAGSKW